MMGRLEKNYLLPLSSSKTRAKRQRVSRDEPREGYRSNGCWRMGPLPQAHTGKETGPSHVATAGPPVGGRSWNMEQRSGGSSSRPAPGDRQTFRQIDRVTCIMCLLPKSHSRWAVSTWRKAAEGWESPGGGPYGSATALTNFSEKKTPFTVECLAVSRTTGKPNSMSVLIFTTTLADPFF